MISDDGRNVQHVLCGWTGMTIAFCVNFEKDRIFVLAFVCGKRFLHDVSPLGVWFLNRNLGKMLKR